MAAKDPQQDIADWINANAGGTFTYAQNNLFLGEIRPSTLDGSDASGVKANACFVQAVGGPPPVPYMNVGGSWWRARVRVFVRGPADDTATGESQARTLLQTYLHLVNLTGYVQVLAEVSQPEYLGLDNAQRGIWVIPLEAQWVG